MIVCPDVTKESIRRHYDLATPFYRLLWGPHLHHGLWEQDEAPAPAQRRLLARRAPAARGRPAGPGRGVGAGLAGGPGGEAEVRAVGEGFLCPSFGTFDDYRGWMASAGLTVRTAEDLTPRVQRTWDVCGRRLERTGVGRLARLFGRETRL